jgi:hypothetical protein
MVRRSLALLQNLQGITDEVEELLIHEDGLGAGMAQLESDGARIEPDVYAVQNSPCHWDTEMRFVHGWDVGRND